MKIVAVNTRRYTLTAQPSLPPKGKQRQIVLSILASAKEPLSPEQIAPLAEAAGLSAVGGVLPSVRYHLHHLVLLGHAQWTAPTPAAE